MLKISSWNSMGSSSTAFLIDWYFLDRVATALIMKLNVKLLHINEGRSFLLLVSAFMFPADLVLIIGIVAVE
jgi:hypothetical protein